MAKMKIRKGKLCPQCKKGKLERPQGRSASNPGHGHHLHCKTCHFSNF